MIQLQPNTLKQIVEYYGFEPQLDMVIEECSELIKAICKFKRNNKVLFPIKDDEKQTKDILNIIEEIADLDLMLQQLAYMLRTDPSDSRLFDIQMNKIERLLKRIGKGTTHVKIS